MKMFFHLPQLLLGMFLYRKRGRGTANVACRSHGGLLSWLSDFRGPATALGGSEPGPNG